MAAINSENRDAWQMIADECSKQRPYPGRHATVNGGRKHKGKRIVVLRHQLDKFVNAFRYGSEANHHCTEMAGRYGYVCFVQNFDNPKDQFWVKAEYLDCLENGQKHSILESDE